MHKLIFILVFLFLGCEKPSNNLKTIANLPNILEEVSGTETITGSDLIWTLNDSGNEPILYAINTKGEIKQELNINAKNNDWEDLTTDNQGNIYIGDFGNNLNKRKNLAILKVKHSDLKSDSIISIERISFKYPNQLKFPPKKKQMHYDGEAFFFFNDSLYIFTKNRVKNDYGRTNLYKIPANRGQHVAEFIDSFIGCPELHCWITSADISSDGSKVVLLSQNAVLVFENFKNDNFFTGTSKRIPFDFESQKESVCFINDSTLYITDERAHGDGGKLYEFKLIY